MIRPAKFGDIPRLSEILEEMFQRSVYRERGEIDNKAAKSMLMQSMQRHGALSPGGTFVCVAERDERVEGFILGILDRVYHIGSLLMATDLYWYATAKAWPRDRVRLFDAFVNWAQGNERVAEIKVGATDAIPDEKGKAERIIVSRGFKPAGKIFVRDLR